RKERLLLLQQGALDVPVFGYGLDNPVAIFDPAEVVLKVSDRDHARGFGNEKRRRTRFERRLEAGAGQAVADLGMVERQALGLLRRGRLARNHIQEQRGNRGVGQMGGDASSHRACSQHRNLSDLPQDRPSRYKTMDDGYPPHYGRRAKAGSSAAVEDRFAGANLDG